jgi:hypothetical protein
MEEQVGATYIDKFKIYYCIGTLNTGIDISTLRTLVWIKLVMIILEWIRVPCVFWYGSISYDNV